MQERFELEVLDRLNSGKFLTHIVFCGGTMLRLCHNLNRFSVDLDFWVIKELKPGFFENMKAYLAKHYDIKDSAKKFHTILFELRSHAYPRRNSQGSQKNPYGTVNRLQQICKYTGFFKVCIIKRHDGIKA